MYANVRGLVHIPNYAEADKYFAEVQPHSRCKKYMPHQRSLKPNRPSGNEHYRIEKHNDGEYYDLILYQTTMARYYKPDPDGSERVLYNGHNSNTSKQFMWQVSGVWSHMKRYILGSDERVVAPLYPHNPFVDKNDKFCADLVLVNTGDGIRIDTARSKHTPHYRYISSPEDKQQRAHLRALLRPFLDLMHLRMPEFFAACEIDPRVGQPFSGTEYKYSTRSAVIDMLNSVTVGTTPTEESVQAFFELCQNCYDTLASKRGYAQNDFRIDYYNQHANSTVHDLQKQVTEKDLEKSVMQLVHRLADTHSRSGKELMPQFMPADDYPRKGLAYH